MPVSPITNELGGTIISVVYLLIIIGVVVFVVIALWPNKDPCKESIGSLNSLIKDIEGLNSQQTTKITGIGLESGCALVGFSANYPNLVAKPASCSLNTACLCLCDKGVGGIGRDDCLKSKPEYCAPLKGVTDLLGDYTGRKVYLTGDIQTLHLELNNKIVTITQI